MKKELTFWFASIVFSLLLSVFSTLGLTQRHNHGLFNYKENFILRFEIAQTQLLAVSSALTLHGFYSNLK